MTSNWYQTLKGDLDVGTNAKDFARISSGSYVDVFLQNPVVIQAVQNAYATPKIYSYQLFFDPLSLSAEVIELLHESGLVKKVAPATATANVLRCLEVKFRETGYGPTVNRYPSSSNLPGTGVYQMRGTLKGDALFTKFNPSPATLGALYTGGNPRGSTLPRFPFTFFRFQVFPLSYAADQPHFSTGASLCAELRECSISYAYGTDADSVPGIRVMNIGGDITLFHG
eukprot:tig00021144_g19032.t1